MKWLPEKFALFADRLAIIAQGHGYSYTMLHLKISFYTETFKQQFASGTTVALVGKYSFETVSAFLALCETNQIIALFTGDEGTELEFKLGILQPTVVIEIRDGDCLISKRESVQEHTLVQSLKAAGNAGLVLFTSGTSGQPKALLHNLDTLIDQYKREYTRDLNIIPLLGFDHIGGMDMLLSQLAIGATLTIPESRTPEYICETIEKYGINVISASPTFLNLLLLSEAYRDFDLSSLRIIGYGSEPMPAWLLERLNTAFPWVSFQQKYGLSETNAIRIHSKSKDSLFFRIEDPSVEFKVVENELWLRGPSVFAGYLDAPAESISGEGWFNTGDRVETDEDGNIRILGRTSDIINVGGEKVFPSEVESALLQIPFISDCQVYAEKSIITGNVVVANVVSNSERPLAEQKQEIRSFLLGRINRYKVPVKISFVDAIAYNDRMKKIRRIQ